MRILLTHCMFFFCMFHINMIATYHPHTIHIPSTHNPHTIHTHSTHNPHTIHIIALLYPFFPLVCTFNMLQLIAIQLSLLPIRQFTRSMVTSQIMKVKSTFLWTFACQNQLTYQNGESSTKRNGDLNADKSQSSQLPRVHLHLLTASMMVRIIHLTAQRVSFIPTLCSLVTSCP